MKSHICTSLSLFIVLFSGFLCTQAKAQCQANWNLGTFSGCTVGFIDASTGTNANTQYLWKFGDGQTSNLQNPSHTYSGGSMYQICLIITTVQGSTTCVDSLCQTLTDVCGMEVSSLEQINISLSVTNPAFSYADIQYSIPSIGNIELTLFDLVGNRVAVLETTTKSAGMHSYKLNTGDFSKGIYFIHLNFEGSTITKKIIIAE